MQLKIKCQITKKKNKKKKRMKNNRNNKYWNKKTQMRISLMSRLNVLKIHVSNEEEIVCTSKIVAEGKCGINFQNHVCVDSNRYVIERQSEVF